MPFIKRSNISYLTDNYDNLYEQNAELINNINIPIKCVKMNLYKPERIIQNTKLLYQSIFSTKYPSSYHMLLWLCRFITSTY
jgi:hypothetical protein